jgi:hypothetical protein
MLRAEAFAEADELRRELDRERLDANGLIGRPTLQKRFTNIQARLLRIVCKLLVRKGGFEPPRSCERQPLKLVRLSIESTKLTFLDQKIIDHT